MADIGVVHESINAGGGAEAVGAHTVDALLNAGHTVTLYTTDELDIEALNERYGTTIPTTLNVVTVQSSALTAVDIATVAAQPLGVSDFPLLRQTLFERLVAAQYQAHHDTLVCTHGEFAIGNSVEYVHFPYFSAEAMQRYGTRFDESLYPPYHRLCRLLKRRDADSKPRTLTNSEWTAAVLEEKLGRNPQVLYPPVDTAAFDPPSWDEMESGFVTVGRIHPLKRQFNIIDIIDAVRDNGLDTHIHIVGPSGDDAYYDRLADRAASRPYVHLEGELPRHELVSLLESHRYGLHARRFEHFGMAVAEMVASRTIPFVHASGGQQEVVGQIDGLCYTDRVDAVEKIVDILQSEKRQQRLLNELSERGRTGGRQQFHTAMVTAVESHLDER